MIIFYLLFQISTTFAFDNAVVDCDGAYAAAENKCKSSGAECSAAAVSCVSKCQFVVDNNRGDFGFRQRQKAVRIPKCTSWNTGGSARTSVDHKAICKKFVGKSTAELKKMTEDDLESCSNSCKEAAKKPSTDPTQTVMENTGTACYDQIPQAPARDLRAAEAKTADENTEEPPPADDVAPDESNSDPEADAVADDEPRPNREVMDSLAKGVGTPVMPSMSSGTPETTRNGRSPFETIDWSKGPSVDGDPYAEAVGRSQATGDPGAEYIPNTMGPLRGAQMGPNAKAANANAGAGATPPSPFMGGPGLGGMPPAPASAAASRGGSAGSGPRGASGAGSQLSKVGQPVYTAPGGSMNTNPARTTATNKKKPIHAPRYRPKVDEGNEALSRMFGSPRKIGTGAVYHNIGRGCLDTVFCNVEGFFDRVDRYPNSDIKWNSNNK